ncbi:MAG: hypothetical protein WCK49_09850, partial [Myxococcaceae bacterium]
MFITTLGDFISFFAMLVYVSKVSSIVVAAYLIPIKSLGIVFGAITSPYLLNKLNTKNMIIISQFFSFLALLTLTINVYLGLHNPTLLIFTSFILSFFKQWFDNGRETASHSLGNLTTHRILQSQILNGFFGAQFIGPIVSLVLLSFFPLHISIGLDCISFLVATILAMNLFLSEDNS